MAVLGPTSRWLILAAGLCWLLCAAAQAEDRIAVLLSQFTQETDPVRKAKALPKLGDAQFELMRKETAAGNYAQALHIAQEYRDEVRTATTALKSSGVDAERHPNGFKQVQIHLRKSLREIDQAILAAAEEQREGLEAVHKDLVSLEKELIDMLFPRQPGKNPEKDKPKE